MICRYCDTIMSDGTLVCPVCHSVLSRRALKSNIPLAMVRTAVLLAVVMSWINAFFWITVAHYPMNLADGFIQARQATHSAYPALRAVDGIFFGLLLASPVLIFVSQLTLRRAERCGKILILITDLMMIGWTIAYPLAVQGVVGRRSPFFLFSVVQSVVFAVLSAGPVVYFFISSRFALRSDWVQLKKQ